jgi:peptide/nickel transport system substrate-binding protein
MLTGPKATQPNKVWDNPEAVDLINRALVISDMAARQALFDDLHKRFVADLPMIPLWNSADIAAYRSNVTGYKTWPASMPRIWGVKVN